MTSTETAPVEDPELVGQAPQTSLEARITEGGRSAVELADCESANFGGSPVPPELRAAQEANADRRKPVHTPPEEEFTD